MIRYWQFFALNFLLYIIIQTANTWQLDYGMPIMLGR